MKETLTITVPGQDKSDGGAPTTMLGKIKSWLTLPKHEDSVTTAEKVVTFFAGNFNVWWLAGAALSVFFVAYKGLPLIGSGIGPWFTTHLIFVFCVSTLW